MCGIFGTISLKSKAFNKRAFCTMGVRNDSRGGDSCGIFIDGNVEYGIDKQKLFINFFRDSKLLEYTTTCKIALGHCRKASVGKVGLETAQPVVIYNDQNKIEFVVIHNGTIYNYEELAKKYIPEIDIKGMTDSQVMARIFYYKGYDVLDEYIGGAVFVIHDYRTDESLIFKGASKKHSYSKDEEEERPLYYCWHNGRFVFSSIFETLYAHYYEEDIYTLSCNVLVRVENKLRSVKQYDRKNCIQTKPSANVVYTLEDYYEIHNVPKPKKNTNTYFKIGFDGSAYIDENKVPLHGVLKVSNYGWVYPNRTGNESWINNVAFFNGRMLKNSKAFELINKKYQEANKQLTPEVKLLIDILDFNPYGEDLTQYYWFSDESKVLPSGEWKLPFVNWSYMFDENGVLVDIGKNSYNNWITDYNMYVFDEQAVLKLFKKYAKRDNIH